MQVTHYRLMDAARRCRAGGLGPKATLLALIERMGDHDGEWSCWPSQRTLADDTEQTDRNVRTHLALFVTMGLIAIRPRSTGRDKRGNSYVLNVEELLNRAEAFSSQSATERNESADPTGTTVPPELLGEHKNGFRTIRRNQPPSKYPPPPEPSRVGNTVMERNARRAAGLACPLCADDGLVEQTAGCRSQMVPCPNGCQSKPYTPPASQGVG